MYIISKAIYFFINPITWISVLLIWALLTKNQTKRFKLLRLGLFTFLFFSLAPIFQIFAWMWEVPLTDMREMETQYDIGIVLGGYSDDAIVPNDRLHFNNGGTRLTTTVELYKKGIIKNILLTGGTFSLSDSVQTEAEKAHLFLQTLGIPDSNIIIERGSLNTHQNVIFTKELVDKDYKNASLLLITSTWHMRRSRACFKKAGVNDIATFSADPFEGRILTSWNHYLFPNATVLEAWRSLIKEWFGFALYKLFGYI